MRGGLRPGPGAARARPVLKAVNNGRGVAQKLRRSGVALQATKQPRAEVVAQAAATAIEDTEPTWFDTYTKVSGALTNLFPVWTVVFTLWALKDPSAFAWLTTKYFTAGLAILMLSMGITLAPKDFQRVATRPNACVIELRFMLRYRGQRPIQFGGVAQWQSVRFACGKPRVQTPAPPHTQKQLRGAMDSVSDFESGGCGFESRRVVRVRSAARRRRRDALPWCVWSTDTPSPRRTTPHKIWTDWKSEGSGFDSRVGLPRNWTLAR